MSVLRRRHCLLYSSVRQAAKFVGLCPQFSSGPVPAAPWLPSRRKFVADAQWAGGLGSRFNCCRRRLGSSCGFQGSRVFELAGCEPRALASWKRNQHCALGHQESPLALPPLAPKTSLDDKDGQPERWNPSGTPVLDQNARMDKSEARNEGDEAIRAAAEEPQPLVSQGRKVATTSEVALTKTLIKAICNRSASLGNAEANMHLLLSLGASPHEVALLFQSHPVLFLYDAASDLLPKVRLLERYGVDAAMLLRMRHPLGDSCQLESTLECLRSELKLGPADIQRVLRRRPSIMDSHASWLKTSAELTRTAKEWAQGTIPRCLSSSCLPSKDRVAARLEELCQLVPEDAATAMIQRWPRVLYAKPSSIKACLEILRDAFGAPAVARMLRQHPALLGFSPHTIQSTYVELMVAFGEDWACHMAQRAPALLGMKWERLHQKLRYLEEEMGRSREEIALAPAVLYRSLEHCIIPRHQKLQRAAKLYGLSYVLGSSDPVFQKRFSSLMSAVSGAGGGQNQPVLTRPPRKRSAGRGCRRELRVHFGTKLAAQLIARDPRVERMSWKGLLPKLVYLEEAMGRSREEIAARPFILRRSLEKCIIPRHEWLGKNQDLHDLNSFFCLSMKDFQATVLKRKSTPPPAGD